MLFCSYLTKISRTKSLPLCTHVPHWNMGSELNVEPFLLFLVQLGVFFFKKNHIFNFEDAAAMKESATVLLDNIDFFKRVGGGVDIMKKDLLSSELFGNYLAAINVDTHIMDVTKNLLIQAEKAECLLEQIEC